MTRFRLLVSVVVVGVLAVLVLLAGAGVVPLTVALLKLFF